jgi:hypothetical protein
MIAMASPPLVSSPGSMSGADIPSSSPRARRPKKRPPPDHPTARPVAEVWRRTRQPAAGRRPTSDRWPRNFERMDRSDVSDDRIAGRRRRAERPAFPAGGRTCSGGGRCHYSGRILASECRRKARVTTIPKW